MVVLQQSSSASSSSETFARTAILSWANGILDSAYGSFSEIPPHDLALILYGLFASDTQANAATIPVSLQNLQFPPHYGSPSAASSAAKERLSRTVQERNAAHVLNMVQSLSALSGSPVVLTATTTPATWIDGKSFVDELRVWRWARTVALERSVTVDAVRTTIQSFLGAPATPPQRLGTPSPRAAQTVPADSAASAAAVPPSSPVRAQSSGELAPRGMKRPREYAEAPCEGESEPTCSTATAHTSEKDGHESASLVEASRRRLPRGTTAADGVHSSLLAGLSPVSAAMATAAAPAELLPESARVRRVEVGDRPLCDAASLAATVVEATRRLAAAQSECAQDQNVVAATVTSPTSPLTHAEVGAAVGEVGHASRASPARRLAGLEIPEGGCSRCVPIIAQAIECNMLRIEKLEGARQRAVAACRRKDASALLSALSTVL